MRKNLSESPRGTDGPSAILNLDAGLSFRINRLARHLRQGWAQQLKSLELSPPQAAILRGVAQNPGCSLRGLARTLGTDPTNLKRCLDGLEHQMFLRSEHVASDRRQRALFLTPPGEALARKAEKLAQAQQRWLVTSLTMEEFRIVEFGLERLEHQLGIGSGGSTGATISDEGSLESK